MKFVRTQEYETKLFEQALFDEKRVIKDAKIHIVWVGSKPKAYCENTGTYLQFPRSLRQIDNGDAKIHIVWVGSKPKAYCENTGTYLQFPRIDNGYVADVVEVKNESVDQKYYRAMKGSIRKKGSDKVVA